MLGKIRTKLGIAVITALILAGGTYALPTYAEEVTQTQQVTATEQIQEIQNIDIKTEFNGSTCKVSFSKIKNAGTYLIMRKVVGGSWEKVAEIQKGTYTYKDTVTDAKSVRYRYRIIAYDKDTGLKTGRGISESVYHLASPDCSAVMVSKGIKIKWNKVKGAEGYYVYRKTPDAASWKKLAAVSADQRTYTDKKASSGVLYEYTVRAYSADSISEKAANITNAAKLTTPVLTSAVSTKTGCRIKWEAVSGAEQYTLYRRKAGSSAWKSIKTVKGTACTDTSARKDTSYEYSVRAVTGQCISPEGKNDIYCVYTDKEAVKEAIKVVNKNISYDQTQEQKLKACYKWLSCYTYSYSYHTVFKESDIPEYAAQAFKTHLADCYRFAASFGYMATILGYKDVWLCAGILNGGAKHGFNEIKIDGKTYLYDSEIEVHHRQKWGCHHNLFKVPSYSNYVTRTAMDLECTRRCKIEL